MDTPARLQAIGIYKRFHGTLALRGVDFCVARGEIVGLVGENGAGKSTLAKIIGGIHRPDAGELRVDGAAVQIPSVQHARQLGIAVVHQELNLVAHLSVEDNILLGQEPYRVPVLRWTDRRGLRRRAAEMLECVGLEVDPATPLMDLSIAGQQRVEIAKALSVDARLLIMDEPTSSLAAEEAEGLLRILDGLRSQGISVVYISHKLDEVRAIADRVVVFRDGQKVCELPSAAAANARLVTAMVGRELSTMFPAREAVVGPEVLHVSELLAPGLRRPVSLTARAGEVLGIAGLVGAGRSELLRAIFGATRRSRGTVMVDGVATRRGDPLSAMRAGIAFVPEDRKTQGLVLPMEVDDNIALPSLGRLCRCLWRVPGAERALVEEYVDRLHIQPPSLSQRVQRLSGGNQQKVLLAKWLAIEPRVLLLDEPTRGIDVGAKHEVYGLIAQIAAEGVAVVLVSSEMEEIIGLCDRALVMNQGAVAGELHGERLTQEGVMALAAHTQQATAEGPGPPGPEA